MDCSQPGSSVHGIIQERILEWVAISSSRDLSNPGIKPVSPASPVLAGGFFNTEPPGKHQKDNVKEDDKVKWVQRFSKQNLSSDRG